MAANKSQPARTIATDADPVNPMPSQSPSGEPPTLKALIQSAKVIGRATDMAGTTTLTIASLDANHIEKLIDTQVHDRADDKSERQIAGLSSVHSLQRDQAAGGGVNLIDQILRALMPR